MKVILRERIEGIEVAVEHDTLDPGKLTEAGDMRKVIAAFRVASRATVAAFGDGDGE